MPWPIPTWPSAPCCWLASTHSPSRSTRAIDQDLFELTAEQAGRDSPPCRFHLKARRLSRPNNAYLLDAVCPRPPSWSTGSHFKFQKRFQELARPHPTIQALTTRLAPTTSRLLESLTSRPPLHPLEWMTPIQVGLRFQPMSDPVSKFAYPGAAAGKKACGPGPKEAAASCCS